MLRIVSLLLLTLVSLLSAAPAHAGPPVPVTACGQTLRGPTSYYLPANLTCASQGGGLVLESATLDLRGLTIECRSVGCVTLRGSRAQVLNGTIDGWMHDALVLEGQGHHRVADVVIPGMEGMVIVIRSNDNRLTRLTMTSGLQPAIAIDGHDNRVEQSVVACPVFWVGGCVDINGHGNRLDQLTVTVTDTLAMRGSAVTMTGNDNEVRLSTLTNRDGPALVVDGRDNRLSANRLTGLPDARDLSGGCTANHWKRNILLTQTAEPACLLTPPWAPDDDDRTALK